MAGPPVGDVHIGISGWRYEPWRGVFYPEGLAQRRELEFASRALGSIEINGSFYSLQRPSSWQTWHDETPDGFLFAVKGPRYITHMRRLIEVTAPLANFLASGVLLLGPKLGPLLWQFPPTFACDHDRFDAFFSLLPRGTADARAFARRHHDERMAGRTAWGDDDEDCPLRHAVEVRHPSFATPGFIDLLRRHRIAAVVADTAGRWPLIEDLTADFVYVRLHGDQELYASGYGDAALDHWARRIDAWRRGGEVDDARRVSADAGPRLPRRDVCCYFDNDVKVHAPYDAAGLCARLGVPSGMDANRRFVPPPGLAPPRRQGPAFPRPN